MSKLDILNQFTPDELTQYLKRQGYDDVLLIKSDSTMTCKTYEGTWILENTELLEYPPPYPKMSEYNNEFYLTYVKPESDELILTFKRIQDL